MDGSLYQRAWDGVRVGVTRGGWHWTAAAVLPTQGTFEESANLPLDRVRVVTADLSVAPGGPAPITRASAGSPMATATPAPCTRGPTTAA